MTRDEARALALCAYQDAYPPGTLDALKWEPSAWEPSAWVLMAIQRAARQTTEPKRPEPTTSIGDLTVTMLNSGGMVFKVKGVGVGGRSVSAVAGPSVIAETLRGTADDLWPNKIASIVVGSGGGAGTLPPPTVAMPGPGAPSWMAPAPEAPRLARSVALACRGNLKVEPTKANIDESGFDLVVNAQRVNRSPARVSFYWGMDLEVAAAELRHLAACLHPEKKADPVVVKCAPVAIEPPTGVLLPDFTLNESKIDRAFAAAEWQFIASSFGLARAALKQAGYPDQQFEGAQVLASTKVDEIRRMGGKS